MERNDAFSSYHPIISLFYFTAVIGTVMLSSHPFIQIIAFITGLIASCCYGKNDTVKFTLKFLLPIMLLTAVLSPLFSHAGVTVVAYLPSGNPITLESILYGISMAIMLGAVLLWFSCFSRVMTAEKIICLFGRIVPSLSLLLSITIGAIPKLKNRFNTVREAQQCIGNDISGGNIFKKMKNAVKIFSIMITWTLENGIETTDSMKSRGFGLRGRTSFSVFRFEKRDIIALTVICASSAAIISGTLANALEWRYFPSVYGIIITPSAAFIMGVYSLLCLAPFILKRREDKIWRSLTSKL